MMDESKTEESDLLTKLKAKESKRKQNELFYNNESKRNYNKNDTQ